MSVANLSYTLKHLSITYAAVMLAFAQIALSQNEPARFIGMGGIWTKHEDLNGGGWESNFGYPQGWFRWKNPSELRYISCGMARKWGVTVGVQNWTDRAGKMHAYFLSSPGSNSATMNVGDGGGMPVFIRKIVRYAPPKILVSGHLVTYPPKSWNMFDLDPQTLQVDSTDANLPAEEMIISQYNYSCGITCTTRIYAYTNQDYSRILMYWYKFRNTGNINADTTIELPGQTLHQVIFSWGYWPHVSWEGGTEVGGIFQEKDMNDAWWDYYGKTYENYVGSGTPSHPNGDLTADSIRVQMWYDGDNAGVPGDDTGDPEPSPANQGMSEKDPYVGRLLSTQHPGYGILYAPKSVVDTANDLTQPSTVTWVAYDDRPSVAPWPPDPAYQAWYQVLAAGGVRQDPQVAGWTDPGGHGAIYGYTTVGPYEMPFNSEINIVVVVGISGMSYEDQVKYGKAWAAGIISDGQKDSLVAEYKDSLLAAIGRATRRYFLNIDQGRNPFEFPSPPPSPDITVTPKSNSINITWSSVNGVADFTTGVNDFAGYRLYRASGNSHWLTYKEIWQGTATSYEDTTVQDGIPYYYYVTAYDDGTQNWDVPGEKLESSHYANRTTGYPAVLLLSAKILSPGNIDTVTTKDTVIFIGSVHGGLPPYHYRWTSSVDGMLSDSLLFQWDSLSSGRHTVKFIVTDSLGNIAEDSVIVIKTVTGVAADVNDIPTIFVLDQNYPNPFNLSTLIRFGVPAPSHVTMEIFNMLGQRIRVLTDGEKEPGYYIITWDGRDQSGAIVPSGVYICRITATRARNTLTFVQSRKMMLLK